MKVTDSQGSVDDEGSGSQASTEEALSAAMTGLDATQPSKEDSGLDKRLGSGDNSDVTEEEAS